MKEKFTTIIKTVGDFWKKRSGKQKALFYSAAGIIVILIAIIVGLNSYKDYMPLYSDLSPGETGQIKDNLDSKGIPYKINASGTTISVPKKDVNTLKVELASEGIPKSGEIDYSFFSQNTQFGMTDKQFDVLNKAAMETELSNLVTGISGVKSAQVMLSLPQESDFVTDNSQQASASIVLKLNAGYQLKQDQIQGLYHLVSKSVPNLPENNIVIMDQYFNYYDKKNDTVDGGSTLSTFQQQEKVKDGIQKDIQHQVQQMLDMMMGSNKVMVNVSTDVDFTKEKTKEKLVEPADKDTLDGLKVSTEHITETFRGNNAAGVAGTGDNQIPEFQGTNGDGNGDYQRVEDRVNNVFNHITNDIQKSPYQLQDLGIQVMVEPPNANDPNSLPQQRVDDIKGILDTIVKTSLSNGDQLTQDQLDSKSVISIEKFNGKLKAPAPSTGKRKIWIYVVAGIVAAIIIALIIWLLFRGRTQELDEDEDEVLGYDMTPQQEPAQDLLAEAWKQNNPEEKKRSQLETLAKDSPEEFAKLLRTWFADD